MWCVFSETNSRLGSDWFITMLHMISPCTGPNYTAPYCEIINPRSLSKFGAMHCKVATALSRTFTLGTPQRSEIWCVFSETNFWLCSATVIAIYWTDLHNILLCLLLSTHDHRENQCNVLQSDQNSPDSSQKTPHSSHLRVGGGVSLVRPISDYILPLTSQCCIEYYHVLERHIRHLTLWSQTLIIGKKSVQCTVNMTSSNENVFCIAGPMCGEFIGHRWIPLTGASHAELWALMFSFICASIKGWVNDCVAGDSSHPSRSLWCHCNGWMFSQLLQ